MDEEIWLKKGFYVYVEPPGKYYKITGREPFYYETGTEETAIFSAVSPGSESGYKNIDILEPDDVPPHLYQVLWGVKDVRVKYYMKLPTGTNRLGLDEDKDIGFITAEISPYWDPNPDYQFWLLHTWYPSINAVNESRVSIVPKIWFRGMKYDIEEVTDPEILEKLKTGKIPCRQIKLGGVRTTA